MNRKAQGQIITTVLIILLVLAAIVIVWQVVRNTVTESTEQIKGGTDCATVSVEIVSATGTTNKIVIKRNVGSGTIEGFKVLVNDADVGDTTITPTDLEELEETTITATQGFDKDDEISIAAIVEPDRLCEVADTATAV